MSLPKTVTACYNPGYIEPSNYTSLAEAVLRISGVVNDSIVDGPGIRLAVFTQGCPHHCEGCHNPHTHDPKGGKEICITEILSMLDHNPLIDGLTLTGGEPFLQAETCAILASETKKRRLSVLTYTGYTWEQLVQVQGFRCLIENSDYIIDGRFELRQRSLDLYFKGSANQRLIDVATSLATGKAVVVESFSL